MALRFKLRLSKISGYSQLASAGNARLQTNIRYFAAARLELMRYKYQTAPAEVSLFSGSMR